MPAKLKRTVPPLAEPKTRRQKAEAAARAAASTSATTLDAPQPQPATPESQHIPACYFDSEWVRQELQDYARRCPPSPKFYESTLGDEADWYCGDKSNDNMTTTWTMATPPRSRSPTPFWHVMTPYSGTPPPMSRSPSPSLSISSGENSPVEDPRTGTQS
ncbi:hypothetical protein CYLTODRAFT_492007 [Cylindrobasidium torrendii FP15055 ss-10]|uniref:Uncharacterized protein n=1 Tax=Cylindrobasidium torrendii FP15055 ss-10 TaxID=1314674 RepID=A0A0D7B5P6_9AGAR|nr:hypothetical protein CYLTODRAFT_492007 [Cylindrobasidium torrendii FP15055 ss-10]